MIEQRETSYDYIAGNKYGTFFTSERKWINKIKSLAELNPDEVKIIKENDDGSILAHTPPSYFKLSPPKKVSEAQKRKAAERFKKMWEEKRQAEG